MSFRALVEKSPAAETACYMYAPAHLPARVPRREIPCNRNGMLHIRASPLASAGSAPRNPLRQKRHATYTRQPTCQRGFRAEKSPAIETKIIIHPLPQILARRGALPRQPTCQRGFRAEKSPAIETEAIVYENPNTCPRRLCAAAYNLSETSRRSTK